MAEPTKNDKAASNSTTAPARSVAAIQKDLDKVNARFREIHPQVELDRRRGEAHAEQLRKRRENWAKLHPGEEFDEEIAGFSLAPYASNAVLQEEFHGLHYELSRLEDELKTAVRERARA